MLVKTLVKKFLGYTKREVESSNISCKPQGMVYYHSERKYKGMASNKLLPSWPITTKSITNKNIFWTRISKCGRQDSSRHELICDNNFGFIQTTQIFNTHVGCYVFEQNLVTDHVIKKSQVWDRQSYNFLETISDK